MFGVPLQTPLDLRFVIFRIPVSVTPFFWLIAFLFSTWDNQASSISIVIRMFAIFLSILVHEMGHALVIRYIFGAQPHVVLHGFGGLTFHERPYYYRTPKAWGQILISFAGPAAGFILSGFSFVIVIAFYDKISTNDYLSSLLSIFIGIGIIWGILNLMPVYPLDGGQISREICQMISPQHGIRVSLMISATVAIILALFSLRISHTYLVFLFGFLAFGSLQMLQGRRY
jgi:Zn-dependent protease